MTKEERRKASKKAYTLKWKKEHPDYFCKYRRRNKARRNAYNRQWRKKHKTRWRSWSKRYERTPKRKMWKQQYEKTTRRKEYQKQYRNTPKMRRHLRRYSAIYEHTPKRIAQRHSVLWRTRKSSWFAKQRALRFGVTGPHFTRPQFLKLCARYSNRCIACGRALKLTPDHVIPFSKGGSNRIANIQPVCLPCNSEKGNKTTDYRNTVLAQRLRRAAQRTR